MCLIARRVGNTLIDPSSLVLNHGITGDAVEPFGEAEKCLHACRAIRDIKFSNQVVEQTLDVPSCIVAYPRVIDTVEQRLLRRLAARWMKRSMRCPRAATAPNPWLLCIERLRAAISP